MTRFKEVELKRQGCVSLVSRMYPDDTLFDYVVYVNVMFSVFQNQTMSLCFIQKILERKDRKL